MNNQEPLLTARPSKPLRAFVDHYWLSMNNRATVYSLLPDGAVDVVINRGQTAAIGRVYGTSTARSEVALDTGHHYLGIRFRPGRSRHFINAAASELTDRHEPAAGLLRFDLGRIGERIDGRGVFGRLDRVLECCLRRQSPAPTRIDTAIAMLDATHGTTPITELAEIFGRSRRQFERVFHDIVGVSPKAFASIRRFHRAVDLIENGAASLTDVAATAGYSDQSHMNREFRRLGALSPGVYAREYVAFLQDAPSRMTETGIV